MNKLYIIAGCNGSGKTTASYNMLPELLNCSEFVNSDEFAKSLSPFSPGEASIQASRLMLLKVRWLFEKRRDFGIETTLSTRSLSKMISHAKDLGYKVTILYFWLNSPDLAVKRVKDRVENGGHFITEDVIRRRYGKGLQYFFRDYIPAADSWILADNSVPPFSVVAQGSKDGETTILNEAKYKLIRSMAEAYKEI